MSRIEFYIAARSDLNYVRTRSGFKPMYHDKKSRTCLRCDKYFKSLGSHHRICKNCESKDERYI